MHHLPLQAPVFQSTTGKPSTATPFFPRRFCGIDLGVLQMATIDISNEHSFLEFCNSIDLSQFNGATFQVGFEVTGLIGDE
jgi:hypothetical protein